MTPKIKRQIKNLVLHKIEENNGRKDLRNLRGDVKINDHYEYKSLRDEVVR